MTSKTFKCVEHEEEVLEVYPFTGEEGGRKFSLLMPHVSSNAGIAFDSTTAPALALAILESAGWPNEHLVTTEILRRLREFDKHLKAIETEAMERAKLEAEALELFNAGDVEGEFQSGPYDSFAQIHDYAKPKWLAVARKAREMRAEK